ncbi:MAG: aminoacyl-tRNA hydrolase [Desulfobacterales bacterium]|nr:aminoacyl-tRNA hydrolase [Desulfobacterales bacterium]
MAPNEYLIVGLGNPGPDYDRTRHNVGFMYLDYFAQKNNLVFASSKWDGQLVRSHHWGARIIWLKPQTYMNRSGRALSGVANYYTIPVERILVIHDDLDMRPGRIKFVHGGGIGGHKGIKSIVASLGAHEFFRLKIGIGRPGIGETHPNMEVDKFVLSDFSSTETLLIKDRFDLLEEGIGSWVVGDVNRTLSILNSLK